MNEELQIAVVPKILDVCGNIPARSDASSGLIQFKARCGLVNDF